LEEPLRSLGEFHVPIKLHREVTSHLKVTVKGEDLPEDTGETAA
jgi:large subunit ribosomal protein L9